MHRRFIAFLPTRFPAWFALAPRGDRAMPWIVGLCALLLYGWTAAPGIVSFYDDSLELQLVAPTFAIAHPTGYPLYTLFGGLWTRLLPVGTWAGRMNLWSSLAAAGAVALVYVVTRRLTSGLEERGGVWAGLTAALTFGLGPVWWSQATVAEVYALHNLLVAALLAVLLGVNRSQGTAQTSRMVVASLLLGLGLAHHRTIVLLIPGLALYTLWSAPALWRPQRVWLLWLIALLAPLLLYLYIPLRAAQGAVDLSGDYVNTWSGFWHHVLARQYTAFFADTPLTAALTPTEWLVHLRKQLGWGGLLLAALGLLRLMNRQGRPARAWVAVLLILLTNLGFTLVYRVPDPEVFLLPVLLCLAIFVGGGVSLMGGLVPTRWGASVQAALVVVLALGLGGRGVAVNRHDTWTKHDTARLLASTPFPPGSVVVGIEGEMTALRYMQAAEGLGLNSTPLIANDVEQRRQAVDAMMAEGRPTYLTRELPGLEDRYSFSGSGALLRVWPRGQAQITSPAHALDVTTTSGTLRLVGYDLQPSAVTAQPWLELTLFWQPIAPVEQVLKVSLRQLDAAGAPLVWPDGRAAVEDRFPLQQTAPTSTWVVGEVIQDVHLLPVPPAQAGALARLQVIVYDNADASEVARFELPLPS